MSKFGMVPPEAAADNRLTKRDYKVLIALYCCAGKDGKCNPKRETLTEMTGVRPGRISETTTRLSKLGWLEKSGDGGGSLPLDYLLTTPKQQ